MTRYWWIALQVEVRIGCVRRGCHGVKAAKYKPPFDLDDLYRRAAIKARAHNDKLGDRGHQSQAPAYERWDGCCLICRHTEHNAKSNADLQALMQEHAAHDQIHQDAIDVEAIIRRVRL